MIAEELQAARQHGRRRASPGRAAGTASRARARAGRSPAGNDTQRVPSSEMPPPGTIMWTCGWCVIAEPQVWSTAVMPMRAPRCFGSAAIVSMRLGRGAEQQVVDHGLVVPGDVGDLGRQREDDMEVADRQQIGLARGEPLPCRRTLAFGAVPVAAGVVGDAAVAAVLARLDMAAEGCGAAALDRGHHLHLAEAQMTGMGRAPGGAMAMEDVGDLQRRAAHRRRIRRPVSPRPGVSSLIRSSGLVTARIVLVATRA